VAHLGADLGRQLTKTMTKTVPLRLGILKHIV
jgi:hypothetical protein